MNATTATSGVYYPTMRKGETAKHQLQSTNDQLEQPKELSLLGDSSPGEIENVKSFYARKMKDFGFHSHSAISYKSTNPSLVLESSSETRFNLSPPTNRRRNRHDKGHSILLVDSSIQSEDTFLSKSENFTPAKSLSVSNTATTTDSELNTSLTRMEQDFDDEGSEALEPHEFIQKYFSNNGNYNNTHKRHRLSVKRFKYFLPSLIKCKRYFHIFHCSFEQENSTQY